jgi:hypothetical protein
MLHVSTVFTRRHTNEAGSEWHMAFQIFSGVLAGCAKRLLALDFDGVICDSCGESSLSAWKAATKLWPNIFTGAALDRKDELLEKMRAVRPVVETGEKFCCITSLTAVLPAE